jgi:hypothetical protein
MRSRAADGILLPTVFDLRLLVVLMTLVWKDIDVQNGQMGPNLFTVGLLDICDALHVESLSGNATSICQRLMRWRHTRFELIEDRSGVFEWAYDIFRPGVAFSVLSHLCPAGGGATPDRIQFSFSRPVFEALGRKERTLSVHSDIIASREIRALEMGLYLWCRRVGKHNHEPREYRLDHLREEIAPRKTITQFRKEFRTVFSKHTPRGQPFVASISGYHIRYRPDTKRPKRDLIVTFADHADHIVGKDSAYSRPKRGVTDSDRRVELRKRVDAIKSR